MIQVQGYYVMALVGWFCMPKEMAKRPGELTHPKHF